MTSTEFDGDDPLPEILARLAANTDPEWRLTALGVVRSLALTGIGPGVPKQDSLLWNEFTSDQFWWIMETEYPNVEVHDKRASGNINLLASQKLQWMENTGKVITSLRKQNQRQKIVVWRSLLRKGFES